MKSLINWYKGHLRTLRLNLGETKAAHVMLCELILVTGSILVICKALQL